MNIGKWLKLITFCFLGFSTASMSMGNDCSSSDNCNDEIITNPGSLNPCPQNEQQTFQTAQETLQTEQGIIEDCQTDRQLVRQDLSSEDEDEPFYTYYIKNGKFFKHNFYGEVANRDYEGSFFEFVDFFAVIKNVRFVGTEHKKLLELRFYGDMYDVVIEGPAKDIRFQKGILLDNVDLSNAEFCNSDIDTCLEGVFVVDPDGGEISGKGALQTKTVFKVNSKKSKERAKEILGIAKTCFGKKK